MIDERKLIEQELDEIRNLSDDDIDTSDIPESLDWDNAVVGKFYRPIKKPVTIRIDSDVILWFKKNSGERKYQTMMNAALREYVATKVRKEGRRA